MENKEYKKYSQAIVKLLHDSLEDGEYFIAKKIKNHSFGIVISRERDNTAPIKGVFSELLDCLEKINIMGGMSTTIADLKPNAWFTGKANCRDLKNRYGAEKTPLNKIENDNDGVKQKLIKLLNKNAHKLSVRIASIEGNTYYFTAKNIEVLMTPKKIRFNDEDYPISREVYEGILKIGKTTKLNQLDELISEVDK